MRRAKACEKITIYQKEPVISFRGSDEIVVLEMSEERTEQREIEEMEKPKWNELEGTAVPSDLYNQW